MLQRFLALVLFILITNLLLSQDVQKLTKKYTPSDHGYVLNIPFSWKFIDCYGEAHITITKNKEKITSTSYVYKGKAYTEVELGAEIFRKPFCGKTDVVADVYSGSFRLGTIKMDNLIDWLGGCFAQTYSLSKQLGVEDEVLKDKLETLSLKNFRIESVHSTDYKVVSKIREYEKKKKDTEKNINTQHPTGGTPINTQSSKQTSTQSNRTTSNTHQSTKNQSSSNRSSLSQNQSSSSSSSNKKSINNQSQRSNSQSSYISSQQRHQQAQQEKINRAVENHQRSLENIQRQNYEMTLRLNNYFHQSAQRANYNYTLRQELSNLTATDFSSMLSEYNNKIYQLDQQYKTQLDQEIKSIILNFGTIPTYTSKGTILKVAGMAGGSIIKQQQLEKQKNDAKKRLEAQKKIKTEEFVSEFKWEVSPQINKFQNAALNAVLERDENYYIKSYEYYDCLYNKPIDAMNNRSNCSKPFGGTSSRNVESYTANDYYNAYVRKKNSSYSWMKRDAENFLGYAISKDPNNTEWLYEKASISNSLDEKIQLLYNATEIDPNNDKYDIALKSATREKLGLLGELGEKKYNKKHGKWEYFWTNGELQKTVFYENGKILSEDIIYLDKNQKPTRNKNHYTHHRIEKYDINGKRLAEVNEFYKNLELKMIGSYSDQKHSRKDGEFIWFYPNGQIEKSISYKNNKIVTYNAAFDKKGNPKNIGLEWAKEDKAGAGNYLCSLDNTSEVNEAFNEIISTLDKSPELLEVLFHCKNLKSKIEKKEQYKINKVILNSLKDRNNKFNHKNYLSLMTKDFVEENNLSLTKLALKNDFDKLLELLIDLDKIAQYDNDGTPTSHYLLFTPNKILQSNLINHLDLNAVDKNNSSLAHKIPFSTNGYALLNSLITSNADIDFNVKGHRGWTPLHFAAKEKKETIYNVMVAFGANENARARGGATPKKILNRW